MKQIEKGDMVEVLELSETTSNYYKLGEVYEVSDIRTYSPNIIRVYTKDKSANFFFGIDEVRLIELTIDTQKKQVFRHLQENSITSWEAISKYRITRLADVIYRLRKDHNISREIIREGKKSWAKYTLIK